MVSKKNCIFTFKIGFFSIFWKIKKMAILYRKFLHENFTYRKNGVYHDDRDLKLDNIENSNQQNENTPSYRS